MVFSALNGCERVCLCVARSSKTLSTSLFCHFGVVLQIFNSLGTKQALVFMDSRAPIDSFVRLLKKNGVLAEALHHHLADPVYLEAYKKFYRDFESGKIAVSFA